jgi:2-methylcitrate dehydratase PrpD
MSQHGPAAAVERLGGFVEALKLDQIPDDARVLYKAHILDAIVCSAAAWRVPGGYVPARAMAGLGGSEEATIVVHGARVPAGNAAFANAQMSIALDFGANLFFSQGLPGVTVFAALALSEKGRRSGHDFLEAVAAGYEVAGRVALSQPPRRTLGGDKSLTVTPRPPIAWIAYGAGAAAAKLARLPADRIAHSLALTAISSPMQSQPDALGKQSGTRLLQAGVPMAKYGLLGLMASASITCAALAGEGFSADTTVLDRQGPAAEPAGDGTPGWDELIGSLGTEWLVRDANFKRYPSGSHNQQGIHAFQALLERHAIEPGEIRAIQIGRAVGLTPGFANQAPANYIEAEFSLPAAIAATAHRIPQRDWLAVFDRPEMRDLAGRVTLVEDPTSAEAFRRSHATRAFRDPWRLHSTVVVETDRGSFSETSDYGPVTADEVAAKARHHLDGVLEPDDIEQLIGLVYGLEDVVDVNHLTRHLVSPTAAAEHAQ